MTLIIKSVNCYSGHMPFRQSFRHSSAARDRAESIFVKVLDESSNSGIGEGCPRQYVTGENMQGAAEFIASTRNSVKTLNSLDALETFVSTHRETIDANPAAWCAIELALLDLIAKVEQVNVEELLGQASPRQDYQYTEVLGDSDPLTFRTLLERYRQMGLVDFKVKLSGRLELDQEKFELMRPHQDVIEVRVDANNLWAHTGEVVKYLEAIDWQIGSIEEPLLVGKIGDLERLHDETGLGIVLDESLLRIDQATELQRRPDIWTANIRVSKMGGLIRSLELVQELRESGIAITIGAHVGESSLLTRAALILADAAGPVLVAQEGAFGEYLLRSEPMSSLIQFGTEGKLEPGSMDCRSSSGFGLSLKESLTSIQHHRFPETGNSGHDCLQEFY